MQFTQMLTRSIKTTFGAALLVAAMLLTGCASITNGTTQTIALSTSPVQKAHCTLQNSKGSWAVPATPASVKVHRSFGNLTIKCRKHALQGKKVVESSTKKMVFGNALFGGVIGAGVDASDGAAYSYPNQVNVRMHP
jgi:uncharacterized protein YceK